MSSTDRQEWEAAGSEEVLPSVYRIPLPLPSDHLKAVNVYAIVDGDSLVLIDAGWALEASEQQLVRSLASLGFSLGDIREFLVTHHHRDHYTQAVALRRRFGQRISLGEGEKVTLDAIVSLEGNPEIERMERAGATALAHQLRTDKAHELSPNREHWQYPDQWLQNGVELQLKSRTLDVIATPGHTRGHVVFHDKAAGALFAGDHVLPHITPSIGVEMRHVASPLSDYLTSLQLIRALPETLLLPAHGPAGSSTHLRVDELLRHHEQRLAETQLAVQNGASSGFEVANVLLWTRRGRTFSELDSFSQILAVNETVAHLEVQVEHGWLSRSFADGVNWYGLR